MTQQPVSTSRFGQAWRGREPGLKDAERRLDRSPSAILDPGFDATLSDGVAGTKERLFSPNQGTMFRSGLPQFGEMGCGLTGPRVFR